MSSFHANSTPRHIATHCNTDAKTFDMCQLVIPIHMHTTHAHMPTQRDRESKKSTRLCTYQSPNKSRYNAQTTVLQCVLVCCSVAQKEEVHAHAHLRAQVLCMYSQALSLPSPSHLYTYIYIFMSIFICICMSISKYVYIYIYI